jgi:sarcosine oxidase
MHDHTAGVISAEETVRALARLVRARGGTILEDRRVLALRPQPDAVAVETSSGPLAADRVIVAAGAWSRELVPWLPVTVTRQTVAYFALPFPAASLPVWVRFDAPGASSYGLPEVDRGAIKLARHEVNLRHDDPDANPNPNPNPDLSALLSATLSAPSASLVATDTCLYTATADEEFIVRASPDDPRIIVGSACSGHGFKFAPLTGRALAELAVHGTTDYWKSGSSSTSTM